MPEVNGGGSADGQNSTAIFLFNFDTRQLEGMFVAIAPPGLNLVQESIETLVEGWPITLTLTLTLQDAWKLSWKGGRKCTGSPFPAQVFMNLTPTLTLIPMLSLFRLRYP